jgi:hypothetical protein
MATVRALLAILEDDRLAMPDAPGHGFAPVRAANLLVDYGTEEVVRPLLRALVRPPFADDLHLCLTRRLPDLGETIVGPALDEFDRALDPRARALLAAVLAQVGVRDARIYRVLCSVLHDDTALGAALLAHYGDPAALPHLQRSLDDLRRTDDTEARRAPAASLLRAIRRLSRERSRRPTRSQVTEPGAPTPRSSPAPRRGEPPTRPRAPGRPAPRS